MNINRAGILLIRDRFKHYRQQIAELNSALENQYYYAEEAESRRIRQARACENERIERERQAESDRWYRENQHRRATSDLERAISYGDDYGIKRATEKLKRLDY